MNDVKTFHFNMERLMGKGISETEVLLKYTLLTRGKNIRRNAEQKKINTARLTLLPKI